MSRASGRFYTPSCRRVSLCSAFSTSEKDRFLTTIFRWRHGLPALAAPTPSMD
jgi:hypothetical protein